MPTQGLSFSGRSASRPPYSMSASILTDAQFGPVSWISQALWLLGWELQAR